MVQRLYQQMYFSLVERYSVCTAASYLCKNSVQSQILNYCSLSVSRILLLAFEIVWNLFLIQFNLIIFIIISQINVYTGFVPKKIRNTIK
jgi:hypothetical protein